MNAVIVAGSGRSGTTWVAELAATMLPARIVFEPFHGKVPLGKLFAFQYLRPGDVCEPLRLFWELALKGKLRHRWVNHVKPSRPKGAKTLVKAIRANLMLAWIRALYPEVPVVYLIRDPRAVIASRLKREWNPEAPITAMLGQGCFLGDHSTPDQVAMARSWSDRAEGQAIQWCMENRAVTRFAARAGITIVRYEVLLKNREAGLRDLAASVGADDWTAALPYFEQPSTTAYWEDGQPQSELARTERWKVDLCGKQIRRIDEIVRAFGLERFMEDG